MRRPSSVITGSRRAVSGSKEVAKGVAVRSREHVAWSIEAAFPVVETELVRRCHFTGEAPRLSSDPLAEAADSGRVTGENPAKRAEIAGTGATAPDPDLIVRLPGGRHAAIALSSTDYAALPGDTPEPAPRHLLDLAGLRQVIQLLDHIARRGPSASSDGDPTAARRRRSR